MKIINIKNNNNIIKMANYQDHKILNQIKYFIEQEKQIEPIIHNIPQMEEATIEDLDAGYGKYMSAEEYNSSLIEPYVEVNVSYPSEAVGGGPRIAIYFYGNYPASSVNAGRMKKIFIGSIPVQEIDYAKEIIKQIEAMGINVYSNI